MLQFISMLADNWVLVAGVLAAGGVAVGPWAVSKLGGGLKWPLGKSDNRPDLSAALCLINDHVATVEDAATKQAGADAVVTLAPIVVMLPAPPKAAQKL